MNPKDKTKSWLLNVVIKMNFCPFAKKPFEQGLIRISECNAISPLERLNFFIDDLALLELNIASDLSTSLVIYSKLNESFKNFNNFCGICEGYLQLANLEKSFQLVVFHPHFYFKNSLKNDIGNIVGRSPYPTIHILRQSDISKAVKDFPNAKKIPNKNLLKLKNLTESQVSKLVGFSTI